MRILFGEKAEDYKIFEKSFNKAVDFRTKKIKNKLNKELKRVQNQCDGGKHDIQLREICDGGICHIIHTCKKCSFYERHIV